MHKLGLWFFLCCVKYSVSSCQVTTLANMNSDRVVTHQVNQEKSGNLRLVREKSGKLKSRGELTNIVVCL